MQQAYTPTAPEQKFAESTTRRISPVDEQMGALRNTQGATLKLLEDLAAKLEPILSAESPIACGDQTSEPHASQLHGEVMARAKVADDIHAQIRRLIERVTV